MKKLKKHQLAFLLIIGGVLNLFSQNNPDGITGIWKCDDGGSYYIRQIKNKVMWFGEKKTGSTTIFSNVANGTISGNSIVLDWVDVPKGKTYGKGTLKLRKSGNTITKISGSGFGGNRWSKRTNNVTSSNVNTTSEPCVDISTKSVVDYLNREIKPSLDMKLDRSDGFLAVNRQRQNLALPDIKISPISKTWTYFFDNVRRSGCNFFYDSKKNAIVLDIKFEDKGYELKGMCYGCIKPSRDSRAPDVNWGSPQILRIFLKPIIYQRSISFQVAKVEMLGKLGASGFGDFVPNLTRDIMAGLRTEVNRLFNSGETQRLFNDAIKPLLNSKNVGSLTSVSLASRSLRVCK
ncbi:hypothetical protein Q4Q34_10645 [Flavivirga abyssicola]|uniref:hypothetical protein n=1 Tax=Flavivirga abyssicola TaxID=3063533 RepID=UPI0026E00080|nr:hypothetical protein [Flavivirga sp. MEBiC07777]WVK11683.1 hypothetical protein Q4Q34_10645 [Flavivirga sp. MEBiC07777]